MYKKDGGDLLIITQFHFVRSNPVCVKEETFFRTEEI